MTVSTAPLPEISSGVVSSCPLNTHAATAVTLGKVYFQLQGVGTGSGEEGHLTGPFRIRRRRRRKLGGGSTDNLMKAVMHFRQGNGIQ